MSGGSKRADHSRMTAREFLLDVLGEIGLGAVAIGLVGGILLAWRAHPVASVLGLSAIVVVVALGIGALVRAFREQHSPKRSLWIVAGSLSAIVLALGVHWALYCPC